MNYPVSARTSNCLLNIIFNMVWISSNKVYSLRLADLSQVFFLGFSFSSFFSLLKISLWFVCWGNQVICPVKSSTVWMLLMSSFLYHLECSSILYFPHISVAGSRGHPHHWVIELSKKLHIGNYSLSTLWRYYCVVMMLWLLLLRSLRSV